MLADWSSAKFIEEEQGMNRRVVWTAAVLAVVAVMTAGVPAQAHHSFPATYDLAKTITIEGTVVQFLYRNPHSFVNVMVPTKDGKTITWAVEWGAGGALSSGGVKADTLKPGDKVKVTGNPARDASAHRLRMNSIVRPSDGWKWVGTFG
jgi:hypothetical protein